MNSIRLEKYPALINDFPFSLGIDLERTPYNLSKELIGLINLHYARSLKNNYFVLYKNARL